MKPSLEQKDVKQGTIIHIGAGEGGDLPAYDALHPQRVVLVEPNPDLLPGLRAAAAAAHCDTLVLPCAVSGKTGEAVLKVFNFFDLSSLSEPTGLKDLFPGLQKTGGPVVGTQAPAALLASVPLSDTHPNWLVIDAPGSETAIIKAMCKGTLLEAFQHIVLTVPQTVLFRGAVPGQDLVDLLTDQGYVVLPETAEITDPEWLYVHLERLPHQKQLHEMKTELDAALRKASKATDALGREKQKSAALKKCLTDAETTIGERQTELEDLQQNLRLALQTQMLANSDLEDLRARYATVAAEKSKQEELLLKLTRRLGDAAIYLHELTDMDPGTRKTSLGYTESNDR